MGLDQNNGDLGLVAARLIPNAFCVPNGLLWPTFAGKTTLISPSGPSPVPCWPYDDALLPTGTLLILSGGPRLSDNRVIRIAASDPTSVTNSLCANGRSPPKTALARTDRPSPVLQFGLLFGPRLAVVAKEPDQNRVFLVGSIATATTVAAT